MKPLSYVADTLSPSMKTLVVAAVPPGGYTEAVVLAGA